MDYVAGFSVRQPSLRPVLDDVVLGDNRQTISTIHEQDQWAMAINPFVLYDSGASDVTDSSSNVCDALDVFDAMLTGRARWTLAVDSEPP